MVMTSCRNESLGSDSGSWRVKILVVSKCLARRAPLLFLLKGCEKIARAADETSMALASG